LDYINTININRYNQKCNENKNNLTETISKSKVELIQSGYKSKEHNSALIVLTELNNEAQTKFDKEINKNGWIGKTADKTSEIVGSHLCKERIEEKINQNRADIEALEQANADGNFNSKFFEIYGKNYDKQAVEEFKAIYDKTAEIKATKQIAKNNEKALNKYIKYFQEISNIEEEKHYSIKTDKNPDEELKKFEKNLAIAVGGEQILNNIYEQNKEKGVSDRQQKIDIYIDLAQSIMEQDKAKIEELTESKPDIILMKEYTQAYGKAFGYKNDINRDVTEYALAQKARKYAIKVASLQMSVTGVGLTTGMAMTPLNKAGVRVLSKFGMDTADTKTRKENNELNKQTMKKITKNSLIYGCTYLTRLKLYKTLPKIMESDSLISYGIEQLRKFGIQLVTGQVQEQVKKKI
jgi:hypothetical protein